MGGKPKLVLITDAFPFGKGEASFLLPELPYLQQHFEVCIISKNARDQQTVSLDPSIQVYRYPGCSLAKKLLYCVKGLFDRDVHEEIRQIRKSGERKFRRLATAFYFYADACDFLSYLKKNGFAHAQGGGRLFYSYWNNYAAYAVAKNKNRLHGARVVTRMHGYDVFHERVMGGRQPFKTQTDKRLDGAYFASKRAKDYYIKHFAAAADETKYRVFHLGINEIKAPPHTQSQTLRLYSCSNLVPLKRVHLIINALSLIDDIQIEWTHIGGGGLEQELTQLAENLLSAKENIVYHMAGYMDNENVRGMLSKKQFDCFISTTQTEGGVPVSMMEACCVGLPIIATDVGGINEIVSGENGILMNEAVAPKEVAQAVRQFYSLSAQQKASMKKASRRLWETCYDAQKNCEQFASFLSGLMD